MSLGVFYPGYLTFKALRAEGNDAGAAAAAASKDPCAITLPTTPSLPYEPDLSTLSKYWIVYASMMGITLVSDLFFFW